MRRTSVTVFGFACTEWPDRTTTSDSASSIWALLYSTTPSLPVSIGPSPFTATIELAVTDGATGMAAKALINGLPGVIP
jgi:hypothetical protein